MGFKVKIHVVWDFGDTDFSSLTYDQALESSALPTTIKVPTDVAHEDEDGITDWVSEEYGYTVYDWWEL